MINKDVGERIKLFRQEVMHMTQKELAAKLGINAATMNRIENGYRMPDHGTYALLATRTVISMDWLFIGDGPMRRAHYEPDPIDWPLLDETIRLLCSWADEHEVDPDKAIEFVRLVYSVFTKRADVTPEQRRDEMHRMLKLMKPA